MLVAVGAQETQIKEVVALVAEEQGLTAERLVVEQQILAVEAARVVRLPRVVLVAPEL
jgi:hypothetical protein